MKSAEWVQIKKRQDTEKSRIIKKNSQRLSWKEG